MNIAATIEIYGGGPGSGCNPEVGKCGRHPGSGTTDVPQEVRDYVESHRATYERAVKRFTELAGKYGKVESRLKAPESVYQKMKAKNKTLEQVRDIIGLRLTTNTIAEVYDVVKKVATDFCTPPTPCKLDDKIRIPKGFYRAFHLDTVFEGKQVEIQIRTKNQSALADWAHDAVYKGAFGKDPVLLRYLDKVSSALYRIDQGMKAKLPECPDYIAKKVGCFNVAA